MALIQWKREYSTGVEAVDYEHRELIDLINRLHDELLAKGDSEAAGAFFGDLYRAISAHFALEERLMRDHRYGDLSEHKADHERLLDDICEIMDEFEHHEAAAEELSGRLDVWFSRHFETHDARLHKALGPHAAANSDNH
jgi:hemerythrin-like metal-binding protein